MQCLWCRMQCAAMKRGAKQQDWRCCLSVGDVSSAELCLGLLKDGFRPQLAQHSWGSPSLIQDSVVLSSALCTCYVWTCGLLGVNCFPAQGCYLMKSPWCYCSCSEHGSCSLSSPWCADHSLQECCALAGQREKPGACKTDLPHSGVSARQVLCFSASRIDIVVHPLTLASHYTDPTGPQLIKALLNPHLDSPVLCVLCLPLLRHLWAPFPPQGQPHVGWLVFLISSLLVLNRVDETGRKKLAGAAKSEQLCC